MTKKVNLIRWANAFEGMYVFGYILMAFERRYFNGVFNLLSSDGEEWNTDAHGIYGQSHWIPL